MNIKLDTYEQDLEDNFEKAKRYSAKQVKQELKKAHMAAKNYAIKDKRISIRVYGRDLDRIRKIALREGLPYQTLITSVLHKFSTGSLVSPRSRVS